MFDFLFLRPAKTLLCGGSVYLRAPRRRDQRQWVDVRRLSRDFLQPWEPTWPKDGAEPAAFRRRLRRFTEEWKSGNAYPYFIFHRESDDLLGGVTLSNIRRGVTQTATIGYWMGQCFGITNGSCSHLYHLPEYLDLLQHLMFLP